MSVRCYHSEKPWDPPSISLVKIITGGFSSKYFSGDDWPSRPYLIKDLWALPDLLLFLLSPTPSTWVGLVKVLVPTNHAGYWLSSIKSTTENQNLHQLRTQNWPQARKGVWAVCSAKRRKGCGLSIWNIVICTLVQCTWDGCIMVMLQQGGSGDSQPMSCQPYVCVANDNGWLSPSWWCESNKSGYTCSLLQKHNGHTPRPALLTHDLSRLFSITGNQGGR